MYVFPPPAETIKNESINKVQACVCLVPILVDVVCLGPRDKLPHVRFCLLEIHGTPSLVSESKIVVYSDGYVLL